MDMFSALLGPVSKDDELKALADTLRKRKRAADFYSLSTIKPLQAMGQSAGQETVAAAERQGVLREAMARRKQEEEQRQLDRDAMLGSALIRAQNRGPLVQIGGEGQPDYAAESYFKERGKADSDALTDIYNKADSSQKIVGMLGSFQEVLNGMETGALSGVKADYGRLASSIGLELPEGVDNLQAARAISNQLALLVRNPESSMGMPGQLSDKDILFLKESMPRITNTPGGNKIMIEVFSRLQNRAIKRAEMASQYEQENGRFRKAEFERQWNDYVNSNSLFDDLQPAENTGQAEFVDPYAGMSEEELDAEYARRIGNND